MFPIQQEGLLCNRWKIKDIGGKGYKALEFADNDIQILMREQEGSAINKEHCDQHNQKNNKHKNQSEADII